jgi:hypothetical protein
LGKKFLDIAKNIRVKLKLSGIMKCSKSIKNIIRYNRNNKLKKIIEV